ncbi:MAG: hypothetical protein GF308_20660 [Candidatus Heimdallarchaeota archaeon]|nr:hypothetical protein [Candidatus Heimdallarchaeota archaeon]
MTIDVFNLLVLYKAMELVLLFWLLALLFKWLLGFIFGSKGAKVIGAIGYVPNFAIKKFLLTRVFRIAVLESDPFKLVFSHENTDRWDILFPTFVLIPLSLGLILGTIVGTLGIVFQEALPILSVILYVVGFLIAVNSIPTLQDVQELKACSARSILLWFILTTLVSGILAIILVPFLSFLGAVIAVIFGIVITTILTAFVPIISEQMVSPEERSGSIVSGMVDLDG